MARKYLRVRGEERYSLQASPPVLEIPPRARRRDTAPSSERRAVGNTSACAEKRVGHGDPNAGCGKYLRVRGEELSNLLVPHAI